MHQQDSHELLRHLLDGLKTEEANRVQAAILRAFGYSDKPKKDDVPHHTSRKLKAYFNCWSPMVDRVFGGELLQSIKCLQCGHISQKMEHFLDLSLPIVETKKSAARRASEESDLEDLLDSKKGKKSKHQLKKEKKAAKRAPKGKGKSKAGEEESETLEGSKSASTEDTEATDKGSEDTTPVQNGVVDGLSEEMRELKVEERAEEVAVNEVSGDPTHRPDTPVPYGSDSDDTDAEEDTHPGGEGELLQNGLSSDETTAFSRQLWKEKVEQAHFLERMQRLSPEDRAHWSGSCSIGSCLSNFTAVEVLSGKNRFGCSNCAKLYPDLLEKQELELAAAQQKKACCRGNKKGAEGDKGVVKVPKVLYTEAEKNYLIFSPPPVLTLHLKRFQQMVFGTRKLSKYVEFPLILDIAPFCSKESQKVVGAQSRVLYSLYGVVSHSGGLHGGHYVACVKVRPRDPALTRHFLSAPHHPSLTPHLNKSLDDLDQTDENRNHLLSHGAAAEGGSEEGEGRSRPLATPSGEWHYVSDSQHSKVSQQQVLGKEAYLLFYERIQ